MNLKEHVRKVLKEEMDTKVLNLIEKIALDYVDFDVCKMVVKKIDNLKDQYLIILMTEKFLKSSYREELQNHIEELIPFTIYVSIADGLLDCKKYVKKSNSEQLSESKVPSQVLRRHNLIDNLFTTVRSRFSKRICDYRHPDHFLDTLYERVLEDLYHAWFYETVTDDEWDVASKYIEHYLTKKYKKSTVMFWENECNKKSSLRKKEETEGFGGYAAPAFEMKPDHVHFKYQYNEESEITERCWKGYTQKGMKTMFGKRYPNCVKKTK